MDGLITIGQVFYSRGASIPFRVVGLARHGQDCSIPMVIYVNLENTLDAPAGQVWTMEQSIFEKRMILSETEPAKNRAGIIFRSLAVAKAIQLLERFTQRSQFLKDNNHVK